MFEVFSVQVFHIKKKFTPTFLVLLKIINLNFVDRI